MRCLLCLWLRSVRVLRRGGRKVVRRVVRVGSLGVASLGLARPFVELRYWVVFRRVDYWG
jgi:hypothetical protein